MNWEAIGAIGEVLGAVGVFASLIYLAIQIRQNTRMMKATIRQQLTAASQQNVHQMGQNAELGLKLFLGGDLTPAEQLQVGAFSRATFRGYENYAYQRAQGLFDESEWRGMRENMRRMMLFPLAREQWRQTRDEYSETLQRILDALAEEAEQEP